MPILIYLRKVCSFKVMAGLSFATINLHLYLVIMGKVQPSRGFEQVDELEKEKVD